MQNSSEFQYIAIDQIHESTTNPRRTFEETKLAELAESIRSNGLIQPITVRPNNTGFEIVAGARRFRAAQLAEMFSLPARIVSIDDTQALEWQLVENSQRVDVHRRLPSSGGKGETAAPFQAFHGCTISTARIAGQVIAPQRPGTAHGFIFLSLEDETGIANAIIDPDLYEANRSLVTFAKFLLIEGALQNIDKVIHLRAKHIEELHITAAPMESHDFH